MQRGRAIEQHGMLLDDILEHIPDLRTHALDHAFGALDVVRIVARNQLFHHEGLEQLQRHLLGQAALIQLQRRADHDNRTARVVHALAQQVLAETALLAAQQVGKAL